MNKVKFLLLSASGTTGVAASIAGAYAMGSVGSKTFVTFSKASSFSTYIPDKLETFEQKPYDYGCIKDRSMFQGINSSAISEGNGEIRSDFFKGPGITEGCLVVNWHTKEGTGGTGKGVGNFRLLWVVGKEHLGKGFVVFATADANHDSNKKLIGKGVAYLVKKERGIDVGKISSKKNVSGTNVMDSTSLTGKFPSPNTESFNGVASFGGFMKNEQDLNNLCETNGCKSDKLSFQKYWEGSESVDGDKGLQEGTPNLKSGFESLYGQNSGGDLNHSVEGMKGIGTPRN